MRVIKFLFIILIIFMCFSVNIISNAASFTNSKPTITSIEKTNKGVELKWKKLTGAKQYLIYKSIDSKYYRIADTTSLSYIDKTPGVGKIKYCIVAKNEKNRSKTSDKKIIEIKDSDPNIKITSGYGVNKIEITLPKNYKYAKSCRIDIIRQIKGFATELKYATDYEDRTDCPKEIIKTIKVDQATLKTEKGRNYIFKDNDSMLVGLREDYVIKIKLNYGHDELNMVKKYKYKNIAMKYEPKIKAKAVEDGIEFTMQVPVPGIWTITTREYDKTGNELIDIRSSHCYVPDNKPYRYVSRTRVENFKEIENYKKGHKYEFEIGASFYHYLGMTSATGFSEKIDF